MSYFSMSMQNAYQFVKDKRPAISPNLNFMGQLVEFERELELNPSLHGQWNDISMCLPTSEQQMLSAKLYEKIIRTSSISSLGSIPSPPTPVEKDGRSRTSSSGQQSQKPFFLKPINPKGKRGKKLVETWNESPSTAPLPSSSSSPSSSSFSSSLLPSSSLPMLNASEEPQSLPQNQQSCGDELLVAERSELNSCPDLTSPLQRLDLNTVTKEEGLGEHEHRQDCDTSQERLTTVS